MEHFGRIYLFSFERKRSKLNFLWNTKFSKGNIIKLQGVQIKEGFGRDAMIFNFYNSSKIKVEEKKIFGEKISSLREIAQNNGLTKCK